MHKKGLLLFNIIWLLLRATENHDRVLRTNTYGRRSLQRVNQRKCSGYIRILYCSRALEWINIRQLFHRVLCLFHFSHLCHILDDITFAWSYNESLAAALYRPASVFKKISFANLLNDSQQCACTHAQRLIGFCDPQTTNEVSRFSQSGLHVRTTDLRIIQHRQLRHALSQGLNHIPLRPTDIAQIVRIIMSAFDQLVNILGLDHADSQLLEARRYLHVTCLDTLKAAARVNKFGFRYSGPYLFDIPAVRNELQWLLQNVYCSGLDKASNNACFICIKHIRLMALDRLMGNDFSPCKLGQVWQLPTAILDQVSVDLRNILPEFLPPYQALPYLMATFKQHKGKYRWLTNAFQTVFSNIALLLTITSKVILDSLKTWAFLKNQSYKNFLQVDTSTFWIVDSIIDTTLNLPNVMHDIFVADICRCYETIPLQGQDNILTAITFIIGLAYRQAATAHPKALTYMWVRIGSDGIPASAKWATHQPRYGSWVQLPQKRLINLHAWLLNNCFLTLGDRVWKQCTGIPMGFSCSPIWCNLYLASYEIQFIQRLARLGRMDLLSKFKYAYRYIDDLCFINAQNPRDFLSPSQPRTQDNPYWIYPLNVLEIKEETTSFSQETPDKGIHAHFMNVELQVNEANPLLFSFRKFDKRRCLPFAYTQYIKFQSNRAVHQAYNIVISQLLPILYISNYDSAAIDEINILISTLCCNGFQRTRLITIIKRFLQTGHFPGCQVDIQNIVLTLTT
jgi:hypothetical protein